MVQQSIKINKQIMKKLTLSVAALTIAMMSYGQSAQCTELTKDSIQCKNITVSETKLCYLHDPHYKKANKREAVSCSGTTQKGTNCKNRTRDISGLCHLHKND